MRMGRIGAVLFFAIAACKAIACGSDPGPKESSSAGGVGGEFVEPPSCIPEAEAGDGPVRGECGFFVRLAGDDAALGTKDHPFATLKHAIEAAKNPPPDTSSTRRVYVCAEVFEEAVEVPSGVEIYGGLNCEDGSWSYSGKRTTLAPPPDSIPLKFVKDGEAKIHLEDITARAADAMSPSGSSIAATADAITLIELSRCDLIAGSAQNGEDGATPAGDVLPTDPMDMQIAGISGTAGCMSDGGIGPGGTTNPLCMTSVGGNGGVGLEGFGMNGTDGQPLPANNPLGYGLGGVGAQGAGCQAGHVGANGDPGDPGVSADQGVDIGGFDLNGYQGIDGTAGGPGKPGQGGGGGGGAKGKVNCYGASGGSGAAGGCGGVGGSGGKAGGSSIALISLGATFVFEDVKLITGSGGNGGNGGDGQAGGVGGVGGEGGAIGFGSAPGCNGGDGGAGGPGGTGGGGLGGHSIGIAWKGVPPPEGSAAITLGSAGVGGVGAGMSKAIDGKAQEALEIP